MCGPNLLALQGTRAARERPHTAPSHPVNQQTIAEIVNEINSQLKGRFLGRIFQLTPLTLAIDFGSREAGYLLISVDPGAPRVYLIERSSRQMEKQSITPLHFVQALRSSLGGGRLLSVTKDASDRIVRLSFSVENELGEVTSRGTGCADNRPFRKSIPPRPGGSNNPRPQISKGRGPANRRTVSAARQSGSCRQHPEKTGRPERAGKATRKRGLFFVVGCCRRLLPATRISHDFRRTVNGHAGQNKQGISASAKAAQQSGERSRRPWRCGGTQALR